MVSVFERYKQPEYTGANRCPPCTVVNVAFAVLLAGIVGSVAAPAAVPVFAGALLVIYLRGYLVPKTPELTKRYAPEWVLALFGKAAPDVADPTAEPTSTVDQESGDGLVDPVRLLVSSNVLEECEAEEDLCLTEPVAAAWRDEVEGLRSAPERHRARISELFEREPIEIDARDDGRHVASVGDERLHAWVSEGAFLSDLAAAGIVAERADWDEVIVRQRVAILKALRSFVDVCPLCDGAVEMTEEQVDSCCHSRDVLAVRCRDCEEHFLEVDPQSLR